MYLCGYDIAQYEKQVYPAIASVEWEPFNISFGQAVCNFDSYTSHGRSNSTSIILLLDNSTQTVLSALVQRFEQAIRAQGLPVSPRSEMEPFHCTLAVVPPGFPVSEALDAVNAQFKDWTDGQGPILISEIASLLPPKTFHSRKE